MLAVPCCDQVPEGWLDDKFVPLGFEANGAWGPSAVWAFEEVVAVLPSR